jgi:hypothetical protein
MCLKHSSFQIASPPPPKSTCRHIGQMIWPRNVTINVIIFGKSLKANVQWTADLRFICLLNGIPSWTGKELSFHALSRLPKYYMNQNDELTLPHPLQHSLYLYWHLRIYVNEIRQMGTYQLVVQCGHQTWEAVEQWRTCSWKADRCDCGECPHLDLTPVTTQHIHPNRNLYPFISSVHVRLLLASWTVVLCRVLWVIKLPCTRTFCNCAPGFFFFWGATAQIAPRLPHCWSF